MSLDFDVSILISPEFIAILGATGVLALIARSMISWFNNPSRLLPGPENQSWLYGSMRSMPDIAAVHLQQEWLKTYGSTFRFFGLLSVSLFLYALTATTGADTYMG